MYNSKISRNKGFLRTDNLQPAYDFEKYYVSEIKQENACILQPN